jgi:hypothetical protein
MNMIVAAYGDTEIKKKNTSIELAMDFNWLQQGTNLRDNKLKCTNSYPSGALFRTPSPKHIHVSLPQPPI